MSLKLGQSTMKEVVDEINEKISYAEAQTLTEEQKARIAANAGLFPAALGASGKTFKEVLGADFNSYTNTGFYELHGTAERPLKNSPVSPVNPADAGDWYVMVLSRATTLWVTQVAFSVRGDQALMVRVLNNGVWGDWKDVGIHQYLHGSQVLADTDLNTLEQREEVGWYYGAGSNTCPNKPDGVNAFSLMLLRTDQSAYLQICFDADTASMYTRVYNASGWKEWQGISAGGNEVVQGTGQSTTAVMSQKAVTDQLASKAEADMYLPKDANKTVIGQDLPSILLRKKTYIGCRLNGSYMQAGECCLISCVGSFNAMDPESRVTIINCPGLEVSQIYPGTVSIDGESLIYDKDSPWPQISMGYVGGIQGGETLTNPIFAEYKKLKIYALLNNVVRVVCEICPTPGTDEISGGCMVHEDANLAVKTHWSGDTIRFDMGVLSLDRWIDTNAQENFIIYKIAGVK